MRYVAAIAAALVALYAAAAALACSCALADPRRALARADGAFVGVYLGRREINGLMSVYRFRVREVVKGQFGETVEVQSASSGASCGIEAREGQVVGLLLDRRGNVWTSGLCQQLPPERLRAAARPLPRPNGSGPAALLVGGAFGNVRTIALDRRARTLAYGYGRGETFALSVCPGGARAAELVSDGASTLVATRQLPSLKRVRELRLPVGQRPNVYATALHCRDANASRVYVFATDGAARSSAGAVSRLLLVAGQAVRTLHRGTGIYCGFGGRTAYLNQGVGARDLVAVDLATGRARRIARISRLTGPFVPSPDGKRLAGVAPSRIVLVDRTRRPAVVRTAPLGRANVSGDVVWLDNRRFVFLPARGDPDFARVYDTSLRLLGRPGLWSASQSAVVGGAAYGVAYETLIRASLPRGPVRAVRTLPGPLTRALAAVGATHATGRGRYWRRDALGRRHRP